MKFIFIQKYMPNCNCLKKISDCTVIPTQSIKIVQLYFYIIQQIWYLSYLEISKFHRQDKYERLHY